MSTAAVTDLVAGLAGGSVDGRRPDPAAERVDAGARAARAVRQHAAPVAAHAEPLRRARARRGRGTCSSSASTPARTSTRPRHWITGARRRGRRVDRPATARRPGGRDRPHRRGRGRPRLSADVGRSRWLRVRARRRSRPARWVFLRTGWGARADDEAAFLNAGPQGPVTPGPDVGGARGGSPSTRTSSASASRRSASTRARRAVSTRPSRSTPSCSAPAATASPSSRTSRRCR